MVRLCRRNGELIVINVATLAYIEQTPDTLLTLTTGERVHVKESVDQVIALVAEWQQRISAGVLQRAA